MKRYFHILIFVASFFNSPVCGDNTFGYISYTTHNIGDDIQALAAKQFLPKNSIPINREYLADFKSRKLVKTLVNGWFMHTKSAWLRDGTPPEKSWPPAPCIDPLLISIHITGSFFPDVFSPESIDYLRKYGPVGARDLFTLEELQKRNIPSYFSGCLSLTLQNKPNQKRKNIIYAVDVDKAIVDYIRSKANSKVVVLDHSMFHTKFTNDQRLEYAEKLLDKYRKAKCVVSTRLHACMPCLGIETPVLLIADYVDEHNARFHGLGGLAHNCSKEKLLSGEMDYDFNNPPENPKDYIPIRNNLIEIVQKWVRENIW